MADNETLRCEICAKNILIGQFGEHMDGHSDVEWRRWPGGLDALRKQLEISLQNRSDTVQQPDPAEPVDLGDVIGLCHTAEGNYHAAVGKALRELEDVRHELMRQLYTWRGCFVVITSGFSIAHVNAIGNWGNFREYISEAEGTVIDSRVITDNGVIKAYFDVRLTKGIGHGRHFGGDPYPLQLPENYRFELRGSRISRPLNVPESPDSTAD